MVLKCGGELVVKVLDEGRWILSSIVPWLVAEDDDMVALEPSEVVVGVCLHMPRSRARQERGD